MTLDYRTENLYVPVPRSARFLRRSILRAAAPYVPLAAETRADHHQPGTCAPDTWPVRLTLCGEHPGRYGDNHSRIQQLQVAR